VVQYAEAFRRVWGDVPVLKASAFGSVPAGQPDNLGVDGMARRAPASTGK
jgi:hypothetical protein